MAEALADNETLCPDDAIDVLEELLPAQNQSYVLGLKLKLPSHDVDAIHSTTSQPRDRLLQVLLAFLKEIEPKPTWKAIVEALRSPAVNLPQLAMELETAHCPTHKIPHPQDVLPTISTRPPQQISICRANVKEEIKVLKIEFAKLKNATRTAIENTQISPSELIDRLYDLPVVFEDCDEEFFVKSTDYIRKSESVRAVFDRLRFHWDYLHPDIYDHLIEEFSLTDLSPQLEAYQSQLDGFLDRTLVTEFSRIERKIPDDDNSKQYSLVTQHNWSPPVYLREVENFRRTFAHKYDLKSCAAIVVGIKGGSVIITLLVPESMKLEVTSQFVKSHCITEIVFRGITLYPQELKQHLQHIPGIPSEGASIPLPVDRKEDRPKRSAGRDSRFNSPNVSGSGTFDGRSKINTRSGDSGVTPDYGDSQHGDSGTGTIEHGQLEPREELDDYTWFWGHMNRAESEAKMKKVGVVGNFAIRINATGCYIMTFWRSDGIHHHRIIQHLGIFRFEKTAVPIEGNSLVDLLDDYLKKCTDKKIVPIGGVLRQDLDDGYVWNPPDIDMDQIQQRLGSTERRQHIALDDQTTREKALPPLPPPLPPRLRSATIPTMPMGFVPKHQLLPPSPLMQQREPPIEKREMDAGFLTDVSRLETQLGTIPFGDPIEDHNVREVVVKCSAEGNGFAMRGVKASSLVSATSGDSSDVTQPAPPWPLTFQYEIRQFEKRFNALKKSSRECLERLRVPVKRVADALMSLPADDMDEHRQFPASHLRPFYNAVDHSELFGTMNFHWNYQNYPLLDHLIREFDLEGVKGEMKTYKDDLQQFRKKTPLKLFCQSQKKKRIKPPPEFYEMVAVFDWPDDVVLETVEEFRQEYAYHYSLREYAMMLNAVHPGSFIVTWFIPGSILEKLKVEVPYSILKKFFVTKLEIAGECVYPKAMKVSTTAPSFSGGGLSPSTATSSATTNWSSEGRAASQTSVEQEYHFVEEPSKDFFCPVTFGLMLQPYQTKCCGKHLSQEVAARIEGQGGACPLCKEPHLDTVLDKHFRRRVKELHVFCRHEDRGCEWQGELSDLEHHVLGQSCPMRTQTVEIGSRSTRHQVTEPEYESYDRLTRAPVGMLSSSYQAETEKGLTPTMRDLANEVIPTVCPLWREVGRQLHLKTSILEEIDADCHVFGVRVCCTRMFEEWLKQDTEASWYAVWSACKNVKENLASGPDKPFTKDYIESLNQLLISTLPDFFTTL